MINIWIMTLIVLLVSLIEINLDTFLSQLKTILIIILSTLVSLRLLNFALTTYSADTTTPNQTKLGLIIFVSLLVLILSFIRITQKLIAKRKMKGTNTLPSEDMVNKDLGFIFAVLYGIFISLPGVVPSLSVSMFIIIPGLLFFILWMGWNLRFTKDKKKSDVPPKPTLHFSTNKKRDE
jgi:hypothetical protein